MAGEVISFNIRIHIVWTIIQASIRAFNAHYKNPDQASQSIYRGLNAQLRHRDRLIIIRFVMLVVCIVL